MVAIHVNGAQYPLADDGHLKHVDQWDEGFANAMAKEEGISLSEAHWEVIHFLREYYDEYNIVPVHNLFLKSFADRYTPDKATDTYLGGLFPGNLLDQVSRIAGLPTPLLEPIGHRAANREPVPHDRSAATGTPDSLVESFEFEGRIYHVTRSGNLVERDGWNEALASVLAKRQGISLTDEHWEIIRFIRGFYEEFAIAPMVRLLLKHMKGSLAAEKCTKRYLYELFPGGPARQGSLIAGLAEPPGCID